MAYCLTQLNKSCDIMVFKTIIAAIVCAMSVLGVSGSEVKTVDHVDLNRYMGRWYEISSYPQWFEKGMSNVSALYTMKDGYVQVVNSGVKEGKSKEAVGVAKVVEGSGNAKLRVSFFRPFYGDYWIIDLADDYSWVMVSNPKRSALWILSRTKTMDQTLYDSLLKKLSTSGFDISKLVMMKNNG